MNRRIYLDYNASSPLHPAARAAMLDVLDLPANAHSAHRSGQRAFSLVEGARNRLAEVLGVRPERIVFTSGATEANALALAMRSARSGGPGWVASSVEHPSVGAWAGLASPSSPAAIPVDSDGVVRLDAIPAGSAGLAVMLANNETGVVQPVVEVIGLARARGVPVHVDATQGPGRMVLPAALWDADTVAISAHKFGGPQGVGALVVSALYDSASIAPQLRGGPQERGRRAGTLNVAGIVGMAAAAGVAGDAWAGVGTLRVDLERGLKQLGGEILGERVERLANTTSVSFPGRDAADLVIALDLAGIEVSAGAACASGSTGRSHVLQAMGVAGTAVRFSLGFGTTAGEIRATLEALAGVLGREVQGA